MRAVLKISFPLCGTRVGCLLSAGKRTFSCVAISAPDPNQTELDLRVGLLTVVRQYLLAGAADLGPVRLQTTQNPQHVIRIDLQLGLTKPAHVRMAGGTLLIIALPHQRSDGRWLRRQLLRARSSYCQREHHRQDRYPDHHPPPGIRPVESRQLISQFIAAAESSGGAPALAQVT